MASSSCNDCSNCRRNDCGYCHACRETNGDTCLFRKCKSVAYAYETQLKWQHEACRLVKEYPHLECLNQIVFHADDLLETAVSEDSIQRLKHTLASPSLKTGYDDDETSMNGNGAASDASFATALAYFSDNNDDTSTIQEDEQDEYQHPKSNRFQCGKCSHCQRGVCHICCFCAKRDAFTKISNRCPFLICETVSYAISFINELQKKAQRAVQADPDRLGYLYESLYGENGVMTLQRNTRESEREATLVSVRGKDESSNASGKRILRSRCEPNLSSVFINEEDESSIQSRKVPARPLRRRNISAINSPGISVAKKTQSIKWVRQTPCRKCDGCRRIPCGLCLRCTKSRNCVFRLCDNCDYAPLYKANLTARVMSAVRSTINERGISSLQALAEIVMAGPLSSNQNGRCDRSFVSTNMTAASIMEFHKRKRQRVLSTSGTMRVRACGECVGCTIPECGLCIHCQGMGSNGRCRCVFRVCRKVDYAPKTVDNLVGLVRKSLNLTKRRDGSSPLDSLARTVVEGPLASYAPDIVDMTRDDQDEKPNRPLLLVTKRLSACQECVGCTTAACGLCIHCKGMGRDGRRRCVFQVCHKADYAILSMARMVSHIRQSLDHTRQKDGSSPLDSLAKTVMKGPLASYPGTIIDLTGEEEISLLSEVVENDALDDRTDGGVSHEVSKRAFGMPAPGYSLLKGLDWKDDMGDWADFICRLKMLSSSDRETAIYFHNRQANELPEVTMRDSVETQKLERALIASIFLLAGLPRSPKKILLDKARHSILLYSLHFENDRRLMTMLTSNVNYQSDLKQILKHPKMHELEPRKFARLILEIM